MAECLQIIHGIKSFGIDLIWEKGSWLIWKEIIRNVKHHVIKYIFLQILITNLKKGKTKLHLIEGKYMYIEFTQMNMEIRIGCMPSN